MVFKKQLITMGAPHYICWSTSGFALSNKTVLLGCSGIYHQYGPIWYLSVMWMCLKMGIPDIWKLCVASINQIWQGEIHHLYMIFPCFSHHLHCKSYPIATFDFSGSSTPTRGCKLQLRVCCFLPAWGTASGAGHQGARSKHFEPEGIEQPEGILPGKMIPYKWMF